MVTVFFIPYTSIQSHSTAKAHGKILQCGGPPCAFIQMRKDLFHCEDTLRVALDGLGFAVECN